MHRLSLGESCGSKVMAKVKVDNRHDKINIICPGSLIWGIKWQDIDSLLIFCMYKYIRDKSIYNSLHLAAWFQTLHRKMRTHFNQKQFRIEVHFFVCIGKWKDIGHVLILWSAKRFSKICTPPVSFHFPMQTKKCTIIHIFMLKQWKTPKKKYKK